MKATIEFNLPEENDEYQIAINAKKMYCSLHDISNAFRNNEKYDSPDVTREMFWEILKDNGVADLIG